MCSRLLPCLPKSVWPATAAWTRRADEDGSLIVGRQSVRTRPVDVAVSAVVAADSLILAARGRVVLVMLRTGAVGRRLGAAVLGVTTAPRPPLRPHVISG